MYSTVEQSQRYALLCCSLGGTFVRASKAIGVVYGGVMLLVRIAQGSQMSRTAGLLTTAVTLVRASFLPSFLPDSVSITARVTSNSKRVKRISSAVGVEKK